MAIRTQNSQIFHCVVVSIAIKVGYFQDLWNSTNIVALTAKLGHSTRIQVYLTKELGKDNNEERKKELMESIRNDSVMRWSHFNLQGEYDFSDEKMIDSIGL